MTSAAAQGLRGFTRETPWVLLKAPPRTPRGDEVVRARAEAAEEHGGLCLALQRAADAGRREAGRGAREGCGGGREGDDELHLSLEA